LQPKKSHTKESFTVPLLYQKTRPLSTTPIQPTDYSSEYIAIDLVKFAICIPSAEVIAPPAQNWIQHVD